MRKLSHVVTEAEDGLQVKRVMRAQMGISHHQLGTLKAGNAILVGGIPVYANSVVHTGDTITLLLPDEPVGAAEPCAGPVDIVYEDGDLMVINKEAPLACQSSDRQPKHSLENRLAYLYEQRGEPFLFRPVNRLDRGTSGLMLAAKHAHAQHILQQMLHSPNFTREYLAVLDGTPPEEQGIVDAPIAKADGATVRRCVKPESEGGKPSVTHYRVLAHSHNRTLVRLRLETGRTHQIRVHMQHLGCPVFGDFLYGTEKEELPGRFALHSAYVCFIQPVSGQKMEFEQPLPEEMQRLINKK